MSSTSARTSTTPTSRRWPASTRSRSSLTTRCTYELHRLQQRQLHHQVRRRRQDRSSRRSCWRPIASHRRRPARRQRHRQQQLRLAADLVLQERSAATDRRPIRPAPRRLLDGAGWAKGSDGYLAKDGKTLELNYCTTTRQVRERHPQARGVAAQGDRHQGRRQRQAAPATCSVAGTTSKADTSCNLDPRQLRRCRVRIRLAARSARRLQRLPLQPASRTIAPHNGQNITRINLPALDQAYDTVKSSVDFGKSSDAMCTIQDIYTLGPEHLRAAAVQPQGRLARRARRSTTSPANPTTSAAEWNIGDWWLGQ